MAVLGGTLTLLFTSVQRRPLPNSLDDLQSKKKTKNKTSSSTSTSTTQSRCSSAIGSATFRRYPSYRDLKRYCRSTSTKGINIISTGTLPASNVYSVPPTEMSMENGGGHYNQFQTETMGRERRGEEQLTSQVEVHHQEDNQLYQSNHQRTITHHRPSNSVAASVATASRVNIQELMDMIQQQQQTSLSSNNTRMSGNDTEKSSLSSDNGVVGGGSGSGGHSNGNVSLVQLTPSTSFVHTSSVQVGSSTGRNMHQSYIAYSSPSLENDADIYGRRMDELNNEVVTVEVGEQPPVLRPTYVFPSSRPRAVTRD